MFKIMKVSECYTFIVYVYEFQTIIGKSWSKKIKHFFFKINYDKILFFIQYRRSLWRASEYIQGNIIPF